MNAKIDIKTPAGKSLEGFPTEVNLICESDVNSVLWECYFEQNMKFNHNINPGDTITIEIL